MFSMSLWTRWKYLVVSGVARGNFCFFAAALGSQLGCSLRNAVVGIDLVRYLLYAFFVVCLLTLLYFSSFGWSLGLVIRLMLFLCHRNRFHMVIAGTSWMYNRPLRFWEICQEYARCVMLDVSFVVKKNVFHMNKSLREDYIPAKQRPSTHDETVDDAAHA